MLMNKRVWVTRPKRSLGHDMKDHATDIQFLKEQEFCLFSVASRLFLGSLQWVPRGIFPKDNIPGHKAEHTLLSGAEVKNGRSYTSNFPWDFMAYTGTASVEVCSGIMENFGISVTYVSAFNDVSDF